jgi:5-methylcytosine-specific restriction protein A
MAEAWQRARKRYLEAHPLCVQCMKEGKYVKATDVDHIKFLTEETSKLFWDQSNWQPLCHQSSQSIKTQE